MPPIKKKLFISILVSFLMVATIESSAQPIISPQSPAVTALTQLPQNPKDAVLTEWKRIAEECKVKAANTNNCNTAAMPKIQAAKLFQAAHEGDIEAIKSLINNGAKIEEKDNYGATPLIISAQQGQINIVQFLLDKGAQIDAKTSHDFTALTEAAGNGHADVVKLLLERGAKFDEASLMEAAGHGHAHLAEFIVDHGMDINSKDKTYGTTAIMTAVGGGHWLVIKTLLDKGANPNEKDNNGDTALMRGLYLGQWEIMDLLLKKGADIDEKNKKGYAPLTFAARSGNIKAVQWLLDRGAKIDGAGKNDNLTTMEVIDRFYKGDKAKLVRVYAEIEKSVKKSQSMKQPSPIMQEADDYYYGQHVEQDYTEAMKLFREVADRGDARAEEMISMMYSQGQGVPQNDGEAMKWHAKALQNGLIILP